MSLLKVPSNAGHFVSAIKIENPGRFAVGLSILARRFLYPIVRLLHRPRLEGAENWPPNGPYLLVANHSAGLGLSEIGAFYALYLRTVGPRPLAGFALPLGFRVPLFSRLLRAGGAIPSSYEAAEATLQAGVPILVFPAGGYDDLELTSALARVEQAVQSLVDEPPAFPSNLPAAS